MRRNSRHRNKFVDLKKGLKCEHCGLKDHRVIDFHHLDESTKEGSVSRLVLDGYKWERIEAEIAKCIPLCSNCHRIEHYVNV